MVCVVFHTRKLGLRHMQPQQLQAPPAAWGWAGAPYTSLGPPPPRLPTAPQAGTHHRQREAHQHHDGVVQHHEELLVQVAARHGPGAAGGPGLAFVPSVPLDLVLVPVAEKHGIDVVDEVGHCELCVGGGKPVSVGQRKEEVSGGKDTDAAAGGRQGWCWTQPGPQTSMPLTPLRRSGHSSCRMEPRSEGGTQQW
ncbi:hypothetical protein D623_10014448 [Myotis brandtii]|uniref:Uncharacterized protein n=1 Tax=Myotis brandtii TaxID=109478 RepID=S7Q963_MYOBR|nr:hypothetical protein D623_10014448 [Myotis brandtii]